MSNSPKVDDEEVHQLSDTWILWYHDGKSGWTLDSYKQICEFDTAEDFWKLYNNLPSLADHYIFLMKKGHPPIWEDPSNINGGAWLFKVSKRMVDNYWHNFSVYLVSQSMANFPEHLVGISLSPKNFNTTLRIWNSNNDVCQSEEFEFNQEYDELREDQVRYESFKERKERELAREAQT